MKEGHAVQPALFWLLGGLGGTGGTGGARYGAAMGPAVSATCSALAAATSSTSSRGGTCSRAHVVRRRAHRGSPHSASLAVRM